MTAFEWQQFLQRYSEELLRTDEPRIVIPSEARVSKWMGFAPASPATIEAAEDRLGRKLPHSLRTFYRISNGWRATGFFITDVLPIEKIGWLADLNPHLHRLASKNAAKVGPFKRDPDGTRLRQFVLDDGTRVMRSLAISSWGDASIWLLDPGEPPCDEEWRAGRWSSWNPGMSWYARCFADLMQAELESFIRLRDCG